jgi:hypothetical protein
MGLFQYCYIVGDTKTDNRTVRKACRRQLDFQFDTKTVQVAHSGYRTIVQTTKHKRKKHQQHTKACHVQNGTTITAEGCRAITYQLSTTINHLPCFYLVPLDDLQRGSLVGMLGNFSVTLLVSQPKTCHSLIVSVEYSF